MLIFINIKTINSGMRVLVSVNRKQSKSWNSDFLTLACQVVSIRSNFLHEGTWSSVVSLFWVDIIICVKLCVVIFLKRTSVPTNPYTGVSFIPSFIGAVNYPCASSISRPFKIKFMATNYLCGFPVKETCSGESRGDRIWNHKYCAF